MFMFWKYFPKSHPAQLAYQVYLSAFSSQPLKNHRPYLGCSPAIGIGRSSTSDIRRRTCPGKQPDLNLSTRPTQRVYSPTRIIEPSSVTLCRICKCRTTRIAPSLSAVRDRAGRTQLSIFSHRDIAAGRGVDGHLIAGGVVNSFYNIDFAILRPGGTG